MRSLWLDIQRSIVLLEENEPPEGYWGCFSGGKDSVVVKKLAELAGVKVYWHYNVTTIDPPELVRFIRKQHDDVIFDRSPHGSLFKRFAEHKTFPNRRFRWCCDEYKETTPRGVVAIKGIRIAESSRRKSRYTSCVSEDDRPNKRHVRVLPIRLWSDDRVWEFIRELEVPYCELYNQGWSRLGCVGCPLVRPAIRLKEFERWPQYERGWKRAFAGFWQRMESKHAARGTTWSIKQRFGSVENLWEHWLHDKKWPPLISAVNQKRFNFQQRQDG